MAESNGNGANVGRVEQVTGVVVDAVFPDKLPGIYSAVKIEMAGDEDREATELVCEVQQHLGDDRVRAVAMDATDGVQRGDKVIDTGGPITVPVGDVTLGRIFNLLGDPIDNGPEVGDVERWPIHRPAPKASDLDRRPRRSSRPASRSSTCSRRSRKGARPVCSAEPASARPS